MRVHEFVESFLAATDSGDFDAGLDEAIGQGAADASSGADEENVFVGKRHCIEMDGWSGLMLLVVE